MVRGFSLMGPKGIVRGALSMVIIPPFCCSLRASITRLTITVRNRHVSLVLQVASRQTIFEKPTSKCFLNIDHLSRTRLHETAFSRSCPFETLLAFHLSPIFQITLVSCNNLNRWYAAIVQSLFFFHADELVEVV